jgi:hypothetical protein
MAALSRPTNSRYDFYLAWRAVLECVATSILRCIGHASLNSALRIYHLSASTTHLVALFPFGPPCSWESLPDGQCAGPCQPVQPGLSHGHVDRDFKVVWRSAHLTPSKILVYWAQHMTTTCGFEVVSFLVDAGYRQVAIVVTACPVSFTSPKECRIYHNNIFKPALARILGRLAVHDLFWNKIGLR